MRLCNPRLVFFAILSVSFVVFVVAPAMAVFTPTSDVDFLKYDVHPDQDEDQDDRKKICTEGSQCKCYTGKTLLGTPIICVKCLGVSDCALTLMADHEGCRHCLRYCNDVDDCQCIQNCKRMCSLPENPVTRIAIGCGILFLATAALAFFFKVFLVCCFSDEGRPHSHLEDDAASLNSVDRLVAHRLRDAPPRYDALGALGVLGRPDGHPGGLEARPRPRPQTPSPPDKPPPYNAVLNRGELCLQVTSLPDAPPPYSIAAVTAYLNAPALPQTALPSNVTPPTPPTAPPPAHPPHALTALPQRT